MFGENFGDNFKYLLNKEIKEMKKTKMGTKLVVEDVDEEPVIAATWDCDDDNCGQTCNCGDKCKCDGDCGDDCICKANVINCDENGEDIAVGDIPLDQWVLDDTLFFDFQLTDNEQYLLVIEEDTVAFFMFEISGNKAKVIASSCYEASETIDLDDLSKFTLNSLEKRYNESGIPTELKLTTWLRVKGHMKSFPYINKVKWA